MAEKFSDALRIMLLSPATGDTVAGAGFKDIFANAELRIYAGVSAPASANDAIGGGDTILAKVREGTGGSGGDPLTWADPADTPGTVYKSSNSWHDDSPTAGTMKYYRLCDIGDDDALDTDNTRPRIQGTIGSAFSDDMIVSDTAIPTPFVVNFFAQTIITA